MSQLSPLGLTPTGFPERFGILLRTTIKWNFLGKQQSCCLPPIASGLTVVEQRIFVWEGILNIHGGDNPELLRESVDINQHRDWNATLLYIYICYSISFSLYIYYTYIFVLFYYSITRISYERYQVRASVYSLEYSLSSRSTCNRLII